MRRAAQALFGAALTTLAACQGEPSDKGAASDATHDEIEAVGAEAEMSSNFSDAVADNAADAFEDTGAPAAVPPRQHRQRQNPGDWDRQNPGDWDRQKSKTKPKVP